MARHKIVPLKYAADIDSVQGSAGSSFEVVEATGSVASPTDQHSPVALLSSAKRSLSFGRRTSFCKSPDGISKSPDGIPPGKPAMRPVFGKAGAPRAQSTHRTVVIEKAFDGQPVGMSMAASSSGRSLLICNIEGPAAVAGLNIGDCILSINGTKAFWIMLLGQAADALDDLCAAAAADTSRLELRVWGGSPSSPVFITMNEGEHAGVTLCNNEAGPGVRVVELVAADAFARAGLRIDDLILSIDGKPVETHEEAIGRIQYADSRIQLVVYRGGGFDADQSASSGCLFDFSATDPRASDEQDTTSESNASTTTSPPPSAPSAPEDGKLLEPLRISSPGRGPIQVLDITNLPDADLSV